MFIILDGECVEYEFLIKLNKEVNSSTFEHSLIFAKNNCVAGLILSLLKKTKKKMHIFV